MDEQYEVKLIELLQAGKSSEFETLLKDDLSTLSSPDMAGFLLDLAVQSGLKPSVERLLDLGVSPNSTSLSGQASGVISFAASEGHLDILKLLVQRGGNVNVITDGQEHSPSLRMAAGAGHLEVIKYLVEQGASINGSTDQMNALYMADMYGHQDVVDFLRKHGADDPLESTPVDYQGSHERICEEMERAFTELGRFKSVDPGDVDITVRATKTIKSTKTKVLFTLGLSDCTLELPNGSTIATEISVCLPSNWKVSKAAMRDPQWGWPIQWLHKIARQSAESGKWPDAEGGLFMNGNPASPLADSTELCGWLCIHQAGFSFHMPDLRWVAMRELVPIYQEEKQLVESDGYARLLTRFEDQGIPHHIDPTRSNVATR